MSCLPLVKVPAFLEKLRAYQEVRNGRSAITWDAAMLALLPWVRAKELRLAAKSEFENLDGKNPLWRIPAAWMKMGREHLASLSAQAVQIARMTVSNATGDYLFPGGNPDKPLS